MDNSRIFDTLERKIEKLLSHLSTLEQENAKLRSDLSTARKAEKDASESKGAVERLEKDRERRDEGSALVGQQSRSFAEPVLSGWCVSKQWEQILRCAQDDREGEGLRMTGR